MTINTNSSSIAVINSIIIVTVVPITIGIILSTDDGTQLELALAVNRELVDVVDITTAQTVKITNNNHYLMAKY